MLVLQTVVLSTAITQLKKSECIVYWETSIQQYTKLMPKLGKANANYPNTFSKFVEFFIEVVATNNTAIRGWQILCNSLEILQGYYQLTQQTASMDEENKRSLVHLSLWGVSRNKLQKNIWILTLGYRQQHLT